MYSKIVNPKNGQYVSVTSKLGKQILKNYLVVLKGGAAAGAVDVPVMSTYMARGNKSVNPGQGKDMGYELLKRGLGLGQGETVRRKKALNSLIAHGIAGPLGKIIEFSEVSEASPNELIEAVIRNDIKKVQRLLELGLDPNFVDIDNPNHTLHQAIQNENVYIVKLLLQNGADPQYRDNEGNSPLWIAVYLGNIDIVSLLLTIRGDLVGEMEGVKPLLNIAVAQPNYEIVKALLDMNADVNRMDEYGDTPLLSAIRDNDGRSESDKYEYLAIISLLVDRGAEPIRNYAGRGPVHRSILQNNIKALELLISKSRSFLEETDSFSGSTPLHLASRIGNVEIVKIILEEGPEINSTDEIGYTALHHVVKGVAHTFLSYPCTEQSKAMEIIRLLLDNGADPEIRNFHRLTASDMAVELELSTTFIEEFRSLLT